MFEWNEQIVFGSARGMRGGNWYGVTSALAAPYANFLNPTVESVGVGFRVALVPEPGTGLLVMSGVLGMALRRRRTAKAL